MRKPDLTIKIYLVPHGYQVSFYDQDGELRTETIRDFAGSKPIKFLVDQIELLFLQALDKLRKQSGFFISHWG